MRVHEITNILQDLDLNGLATNKSTRYVINFFVSNVSI